MFVLVAFQWLMKNIKFVLIALGVMAAIFFGYKFVALIQKSATQEMTIQVQKQSIDNLKENVNTLELTIALRDKIVEARDNEIETLENRLGSVTENLGDDANDPAPKSIKELFRRLNNE